MRFLVLFMSVLVSGCSIQMPDLELPSFLKRGEKAENQIVVTSAAVRLTAPRGFCVDPQSTKNGSGDAFVTFGNCAVIAGKSDLEQPFFAGIATVSVAVDQAPEPQEFQAENIKAFFQSESGRRALSRTGNAATVKIEDSFVEDGGVYLLVSDSSPPAISGASESFWRCYSAIGNAVVATSVFSFEKNSETRDAGLGTLRGFVANMSSKALES